MFLASLLRSDLILALKNKRTNRTELLRCLLSRIKNKEIDLKRPLEEGEVVLVIKQELKQRYESQADANQAGRLDLAKKDEESIEYLQNFLPKMMSGPDTKQEIKDELAKISEVDKQNFGLVMSKIMPKLKNRVEAGEVAKFVREFLSLEEK